MAEDPGVQTTKLRFSFDFQHICFRRLSESLGFLHTRIALDNMTHQPFPPCTVSMKAHIYLPLCWGAGCTGSHDCIGVDCSNPDLPDTKEDKAPVPLTITQKREFCQVHFLKPSMLSCNCQRPFLERFKALCFHFYQITNPIQTSLSGMILNTPQK